MPPKRLGCSFPCPIQTACRLWHKNKPSKLFRKGGKNEAIHPPLDLFHPPIPASKRKMRMKVPPQSCTRKYTSRARCQSVGWPLAGYALTTPSIGGVYECAKRKRQREKSAEPATLRQQWTRSPAAAVPVDSSSGVQAASYQALLNKDRLALTSYKKWTEIKVCFKKFIKRMW